MKSLNNPYEGTMIEFKVDDMTCGHCASVINKSVQAVEPGARVEVDLVAKRVRIDAHADACEFADAIREAGYTPVAVK